MESSSSFKYGPLETDEFRLLWILPGSTLRCELKCFKIHEPPPYFALSYTWGGTGTYDYITINNTGLGVGKNLYEALHKAGALVQEAERYFWIDAICINHEDHKERSAQVLLMRRIYDNAEVVLVWVGDESNDSRFAIEKMEEFRVRLSALIGSPEEDENFTVVTGLTKITPQDPVFGGAEGSESYKAWQAIANLLRRPWFSRAWIVQEVTGTNIQILVCGGKYTDWWTVRSIILIASELSELGVFHIDTNCVTASTQLDSFGGRRHHKSRCLMLDLCGELRVYESTDPRDKIYAISGLATDLEEGDLVPDYSKPFQDVYMDIVHFSLSKSLPDHKLDFLGFVIRPSIESSLFQKAYDALPSWVPDWRTQINVRPFSKWRVHRREDRILEKVYNASEGTCFEGSISMEQLRVRGFIVDRISRALDIDDRFRDTQNSNPDSLDVVWHNWRPDDPNELYMTSETTEIASLRTITADALNDSEDIKPSRPHVFSWQTVRKTQEDPEDVAGFVHAQRIGASLRNATFGRRFIWTEKGLMGLAPAGAIVGDEICVFFGGQVLYVLRSIHESKFNFIGECYIHGLMDGEAFNHTENFDAEWWTVLEDNLRTPIALTHAVLPSMVSRGTGIVISTTFRTGVTHMAFSIPFAVAHSAMIRFHHSLDDEVRPKGIYSYAVHPGTVASHLHDPDMHVDPRHFTLEPRMQLEKTSRLAIKPISQ